MKRLAILLVLFVSPLGCKKAFDTTPGPDEKVQVVPGGSGNLTGGGGAVQGTRKAAARTVNDHYLNQLHQIIFAAMTADGDQRMPSAEQIMQEVAQSKQIVAMIKDEIVILTDTKNSKAIWAYTKWPQRAEKHYVLTDAGRSDMTAAELEQALKAQGSVVKLEK
jgi:hypothetical protein